MEKKQQRDKSKRTVSTGGQRRKRGSEKRLETTGEEEGEKMKKTQKKGELKSRRDKLFPTRNSVS